MKGRLKVAGSRTWWKRHAEFAVAARGVDAVGADELEPLSCVGTQRVPSGLYAFSGPSMPVISSWPG